jgi:hypothetical protein
MAKDGMERSRRPVGIEWTSPNFLFLKNKKNLETHPRRRRRRKLLFFRTRVMRWNKTVGFSVLFQTNNSLKRHTARTHGADRPNGSNIQRRISFGFPPQNPTLKRNSKKMEKCTWTAGSSVTLFCGGRRWSGPAGHVVIHIRLRSLLFSLIFFFLLLLVAYTVLE